MNRRILLMTYTLIQSMFIGLNIDRIKFVWHGICSVPLNLNYYAILKGSNIFDLYLNIIKSG